MAFCASQAVAKISFICESSCPRRQSNSVYPSLSFLFPHSCLSTAGFPDLWQPTHTFVFAFRWFLMIFPMPAPSFRNFRLPHPFSCCHCIWKVSIIYPNCFCGSLRLLLGVLICSTLADVVVVVASVVAV